MNKAIVLHDRYSNEPVVIRTSAINAVRKAFEKVPDITDEYSEEYSEILIGLLWLSVKETIGTVITKINQAESEVSDADSN